MGDSATELKHGDTGDSVAHLHELLTVAGYLVETRAPNSFGDETEERVLAFQRRRGIEPTGVVDQDTWDSLVEAGHDFGGRLMCRRTPMMRGDDVAELQLMLGSLGFDAGWIDGIFGSDTESAVADFQRNSGLPVDGVAGPTTCATLTRIRLSANAARPVAAVREKERIRIAQPTFAGRRIVVGDLGVSPTLAGSIGRQLRKEGARVLLMHHPDGSTHARAANQFDAEVYIGITTVEAPTASALYYETDSFSSEGGRKLAELTMSQLETRGVGHQGEVLGRRNPVLRETRMPAVLVRACSSNRSELKPETFSDAVFEATRLWLQDPQ